MNRDEEIDLYGRRAARTIGRFRVPADARVVADEKVQQWTPWAYRFANDYLSKHPKIAGSIKANGFTWLDIYQSSLEGMTKASRVHVETEGAFSAYAVWYMRKEIQRLARRGKSVRPGVSLFADPRYTEASPIQSVILDEETEKLREWMQGLPTICRDILMDHFSGVVQDETVRRVGLSKLTIRKYRDLSLRWLKFFAGVGPEPETYLPGMKRYRGTVNGNGK